MRVIRLLAVALMSLTTGCVMVSMHSTRSVQVHVTDRKTNEPVTHVPVAISYDYVGYGVFYVLRIPKPASTETDAQGVATLPMADFSLGTISFEVNKHRYQITKELIHHGGIVPGGYWMWNGDHPEKTTYYPPPYEVWVGPFR